MPQPLWPRTHLPTYLPCGACGQWLPVACLPTAPSNWQCLCLRRPWRSLLPHLSLPVSFSSYAFYNPSHSWLLQQSSKHPRHERHQRHERLLLHQLLRRLIVQELQLLLLLLLGYAA